MEGAGEIAAPGVTGGLFRLDLDQSPGGTLVEQRIWNPVVALRYRAGAIGARVNPFVSAGVSYTWFTDETVQPAFEQAIDRQFGRPLALAQARPGRTRTRASVDPLWAPFLGTGVEWRFAPMWSLGASVGYAPLRVHTRVRTSAADGTSLATVRTRTNLEVAGAAVVVTYHFSDSDRP